MDERPVDPALVGRLDYYLRNVPTENLPRLFDALLRHRSGRIARFSAKPVADPALYILYRWGQLPPRTYFGLIHECPKKPGEPAERYPRLSDVTQIPVQQLLSCTNFGPSSFAELIVVMKDFGWTVPGPAGAFVLSDQREAAARRRIAKRREREEVDHRYYDGLLREMERDGLSVKALAERHGRSVRNLGVQIKKYREWLAFRESNPFPEPLRR